MSLFNLAKFVGHAGFELDWKVECDDLYIDDWKCLAFLANQKLPAFRDVVGVPRGGINLAEQLLIYAHPKAALTVITDDVYTTGTSIFEFAGNRRDVIGCVAFARTPVPSWIIPIWRLY